MQLKRVVLAIVAGACGAAVMAGCGSETVAGEAVVARPTSGLSEPVFSPCDDIPDEVLRGVGLDPATESRDILGVNQPGWNICKWIGSGYSQTVFATTYSMADVRANPRYTDFQQQEVGDREAYSFREVADASRERCDVAIETSDGAVLMRASISVANPTEENPCDIALRAARAYEPVVPR